MILGLASVGGKDVRADVIYNSLDQSTSYGYNAINTLADSFSTGGSASSLADVQVFLQGSGSGSGSITVSLYSDTNTSPGALVAILGTLSDSAATSGTAVYDFSSFAPVALDTSTRYWIELAADPTNGTDLAWERTSSTSGPGVAGEFYSVQGNTNPNSAIPFQLTVSTTVAVPEPASLVLCAIAGIVVLGIARVRRKCAMA